MRHVPLALPRRRLGGEPTDTRGVCAEPPDIVPRKIGGYTLKQTIGSGGMGTVYLAAQDRPRRTVALKIMRAGIASRSAMHRFEYEA